MSRNRLSMRKIKEVMRLLWSQDRSAREVAVSCGLARSTVREYERRALAAGLSWPLPDEDDATLENRVFPQHRMLQRRHGQPRITTGWIGSCVANRPIALPELVRLAQKTRPSGVEASKARTPGIQTYGRS